MGYKQFDPQDTAALLANLRDLMDDAPIGETAAETIKRAAQTLTFQTNEFGESFDKYLGGEVSPEAMAKVMFMADRAGALNHNPFEEAREKLPEEFPLGLTSTGFADPKLLEELGIHMDELCPECVPAGGLEYHDPETGLPAELPHGLIEMPANVFASSKVDFEPGVQLPMGVNLDDEFFKHQKHVHDLGFAPGINITDLPEDVDLSGLSLPPNIGLPAGIDEAMIANFGLHIADHFDAPENFSPALGFALTGSDGSFGMPSTYALPDGVEAPEGAKKFPPKPGLDDFNLFAGEAFHHDIPVFEAGHAFGEDVIFDPLMDPRKAFSDDFAMHVDAGFDERNPGFVAIKQDFAAFHDPSFDGGFDFFGDKFDPNAAIAGTFVPEHIAEKADAAGVELDDLFAAATNAPRSPRDGTPANANDAATGGPVDTTKEYYDESGYGQQDYEPGSPFGPVIIGPIVLPGFPIDLGGGDTSPPPAAEPPANGEDPLDEFFPPVPPAEEPGVGNPGPEPMPGSDPEVDPWDELLDEWGAGSDPKPTTPPGTSPNPEPPVSSEPPAGYEPPEVPEQKPWPFGPVLDIGPVYPFDFSHQRVYKFSTKSDALEAKLGSNVVLNIDTGVKAKKLTASRGVYLIGKAKTSKKKAILPIVIDPSTTLSKAQLTLAFADKSVVNYDLGFSADEPVQLTAQDKGKTIELSTANADVTEISSKKLVGYLLEPGSSAAKMKKAIKVKAKVLDGANGQIISVKKPAKKLKDGVYTVTFQNGDEVLYGQVVIGELSARKISGKVLAPNGQL